MKQSRRNQRNEIARAEKRSDGPPRQSKYALKIARERETALGSQLREKGYARDA